MAKRMFYYEWISRRPLNTGAWAAMIAKGYDANEQHCKAFMLGAPVQQ